MKITIERYENGSVCVEMEFAHETQVLYLTPNGALQLASVLLDKVQNPSAPEGTVLEINAEPWAFPDVD